MPDNETTRTSRFLSLILRYEPERVGLEQDSAGWVRVKIRSGDMQRAGHVYCSANGVRLVEHVPPQLIE